MDGSVSTPSSKLSQNPADQLGYAAAAGDLNGDAVDDLFVSSLATKRVYALTLADTDDDRQLEGRNIRDAIIEASDLRVRPVLMTSIATVAGAIPLMMGHGAGAESRFTIGTVIFFGLLVATMLTLFVVPVFYDLLARFTKSPEATAKEIEAYEDRQAVARPAE